MEILKKVFNKYVVGFGSIASIVALFTFAFSESWSTIVVLSVALLFLIVLFWRALHVLNNFIDQQNPNDYSKRSSFIKFEATDKEHVDYHVYRLIQSKKLALTEVEHQFSWSGENFPEIHSELQEVENIYKTGEDEYDKTILKLEKPLWYNETSVIHFNAKCYTPNQGYSPYVNMRVPSHIDMIHFRVVLKYLPDSYNKNARIYKKPINSEFSTSFKPIEAVTFDQVTKSYEHVLLNPEPGYFYKIQWEID